MPVKETQKYPLPNTQAWQAAFVVKMFKEGNLLSGGW
jgi:hypothetical protein